MSMTRKLLKAKVEEDGVKPSFFVSRETLWRIII